MIQHNHRELHFVVSWLSSAQRAWFERPGILPETPHLKRWLSRADRVGITLKATPSQAAFRYFDLNLRDSDPAPWAAITGAGEDASFDAGCWIRIDPVHLRPDMARLLLFAYPDVILSEAEAQGLAKTVASYLDDWGELRVLHPARWYLRLRDTTPLETTPLDRVMGQDIRHEMPTGMAGKAWRTRINEIQMALHEHTVNQAREAQGLPAVNSIWPWGWGVTPTVPNAAYDSVAANSPLIRGLARLAGITAIHSLDHGSWSEHLETPGRHLFWLDADNPRAAGDPAHWGEWIAALESRWIVPLAEALRRNRLDQVTLHTGNGQAWRVSSSSLRRFWRRPRSLSALLRFDAESSA